MTKLETLLEQARALCYAIEALPAGEKQTELSIKASAVSWQLQEMVKAESQTS